MPLDTRSRAEQRVSDHLLDDFDWHPFRNQQADGPVARRMKCSPFESCLGEETEPNAKHVARMERCAKGRDEHQPIRRPERPKEY